MTKYIHTYNLFTHDCMHTLVWESCLAQLLLQPPADTRSSVRKHIKMQRKAVADKKKNKARKQILQIQKDAGLAPSKKASAKRKAKAK